MTQTHNSAEQLSEKLNDFADAYHDWRDWIEHGYGNYYDQVFKEKQATYERLRGELLAAALPPAAAPAPAVPQGEPVYQLARAIGPVSGAWIDVAEDVYDDAGLYPSDFKRRILYATPAAPAQEPVTLTDEAICKMARQYAGTIADRSGHNAFLFTLTELLAFIAALREKEKHK